MSELRNTAPRDPVDALLVRILWTLDIEIVKRIARWAQERVAEDAFVRGLGGNDKRLGGNDER